MTGIIIVGLIVVGALLWRRVEALGERVEALELAAAPPVFAPDPVRVAPIPVHIPTPVATAPVPVPAPPPPIPTPEPVEVAAEPATRPGFEDLFGRRLPIWAGGVTLAVAGFLIVRYSIDAGLLSPVVRVVFGLLFGLGLIGSAELALRRDAFVRDPRVAQALSGAGVATLYASILVAANLYALVGSATAFVGLAGVTALAGGLALRFGAPSALLGLVGGLAAPALVGSGPPDVPLLSAYLALAVAGLCTLSHRQGWMWLGAAALVGGFGWGAVLVLGGALDLAGSLSVGLYTLLLGVGLPVLLFGGERGTIVRLGGALAGCAQMAALVATGGFEPLNWGLFALLAVAGVWLARREPALRPLAPVALVTTLLLMAAWPAPGAAMLAAVIAGAALIFGGPAAWDLWRERGRVIDAAQIAVLAVSTPMLPLLQLEPGTRTVAGLALIGAVLAGGVAALGWRTPGRRDDARFAILTTTAAVLAAWAGVALAPAWADAPVAAIIAAGLLLLAHRAADERVELAAWALAGTTLFRLALHGVGGDDLARAVGLAGTLPNPVRVVAWSVPALVAALFAVRGRIALAPHLAQPAAMLLAYVATAQIVPVAYGPVAAALLLAAAFVVRDGLPARATAVLLAAAWALLPLGEWLGGAGLALAGVPIEVGGLPSVEDALLRLALPALALLAALRTGDAWRRPALVAAGLLGGVVAHTLYKQLFAIDTPEAFVAYGMAERTVWQALLAVAALVAYRRAPAVAQVLGVASLMHFGWFTAVLHNPLWTAQAVGAWPVANLVTAAYGTALLLLVAAARLPLAPGLARARHWAVMTVVVLFGASTLRQLAHGSLLDAAPVGDGENIVWSLLGIGLAVGFLRHGIAVASRDWRIASLLLMLAAVAKVFLLDADGLDGLLRIGAFAGLGFSLIGVGWLYSRYLPQPAR